MSQQGSSVRRRLLRIITVSFLVAMATVLLPAMALADSDETNTGRSQVHRGDWTTIEPWASLLAGSTTSDGMQLSTAGPTVFYEDVESGVGGWTATSPWGITSWDPFGWGPNNAWSDSPAGNYANNANSALTSPVIDLTAATPDQSVFVVFSYDCRLEYGDYVYLEFSGNGGASWDYAGVTLRDNYYDDIYYEFADVPVSLRTSNFKLRFRLVTNSSVTADGVHIDDIAVAADPTDYVAASSPLIAYSGTWSNGTLYDPEYKETYYHKYSTKPGDLIQIAFTGPAFSVSGAGGPNYGIATYSVDGGPVEEIDYYWDPEWGPGYSRYPINGFMVDGLSDGPHTLTICNSGQKNPDSSGYAISLSNVVVWGTLTQASSPVPRYQENDASIYKTSNWAANYSTLASGYGFASVNAPGAAASITFDGTYLGLYAKKGPGCGIAQVCVDDQSPVYVDMYKAYDQYKQRVFNTGLLEDGSHTVRIYWAGVKNTYAYSTAINLDAVDVLGTLTSASRPDPVWWSYQQTDTKITYLGSWSTAASTSYSGGSRISTSQAGAAAIVKFTGTSFTLKGTKAASYGKAEVLIDGALPVPGDPSDPANFADFYAASTANKQVVYTKAGLDLAEHTVIIKCTGTSINVDSLELIGYLEQAEAPGPKVQQDNTLVETTGTWSTTSTSYASGYSLKSTKTAGSALTISFSGKYLALYAKKGPGGGKARLVLDGGTPVPVDLYASYDQYKQKVYNTGLLPDMSHTLTIYWTGEKNYASYSSSVNVDCFDVLGSLTDPPDIQPITWRYEQGDTRFTFVGAWAYGVNASASGGSLIATSQIGAGATFKFTGTSFKLYAKTAASYGMAEVRIDGALPVPGDPADPGNFIDFYRPTTSYKVAVYEKTGLSYGTHTITIKRVANTNPASTTGGSINVDALDIIGWPAQAPQMTPRIQETDLALCTWVGSAWTATTGNYSFSGGGCKSANTVGHNVTINFTGNYLAWVARTNSYYGQAWVTVDGGTPVLVDLYSAVSTFKKTVFNTGLLSDGAHYVIIEWAGTKNSRSTGTSINVDAFDIVQTP